MSTCWSLHPPAALQSLALALSQPQAPGSSHMPDGDWGNFLLNSWNPALAPCSFAPADRAQKPQPHAEGRAAVEATTLGWNPSTSQHLHLPVLCLGPVLNLLVPEFPYLCKIG